jgi:hypothetical protein
VVFSIQSFFAGGVMTGIKVTLRSYLELCYAQLHKSSVPFLQVGSKERKIGFFMQTSHFLPAFTNSPDPWHRKALKNVRPLDERVPDSINPENLDQLYKELPIDGIWIATHGPLPANNQQFFHARGSSYFSSEVVDYLASEIWWNEQFPSLVLCPINLSISAHEVGYVYICTYCTNDQIQCEQEEDQLWGCWLVWARKPLTSIQKFCMEQQVRYLQEQQLRTLSQTRLNRQVQSLRQALYQTEHQLRTPLALVELYADLLHQSLPDELFKEKANYIRKTVREMDISLKRLTGQKEKSASGQCRYDLSRLIAESVEELQPCLDQKSIRFQNQGCSVSLWGDSWQIKQVFKNLLNNAIAFSPQNGVITCQGQIAHNEVLIEIDDQGPGFSQTDLSNLFTPFYSRRSQGTGLGLVIARDIITAHQGRLQVSNRPSGGALIAITLPRN